MKIVVVGAGAMGSLYGGLLAASEQEVWLVDIWKEHIDAVRSGGLVIEEEGRLRTIPVQGATDIGSVGKADLVLVFVKTYNTETAITKSRVLQKENTVFLSLQNGLGNEEVLSRQVDAGKVLLGVTNHGATVLGPGKIRHAGSGKTYLGELDGKRTDRIEQIAQVFRRARIETEVTAEIYRLIWEKLIINIGINALAALTGIKNGQLLEHPETVTLMKALVKEAVEVAGKKGIAFEGDPIEKVMAVAKATGANRCSMGQDLDRRRITEIDVINGAVVKEAERLGISVPHNQTLTYLVKVIERGF
jgi:2-dehydropantoate 2-reductase